MAEVRLSIAAREYAVNCNDGEEARLTALAELVDEKARAAGLGLSENRQLLFAALFLADQLLDQTAQAPEMQKPTDPGAISSEGVDRVAAILERVAQQLESLADRA
jgi:cell division protein ZapA